jgi:hypothetical protein
MVMRESYYRGPANPPRAAGSLYAYRLAAVAGKAGETGGR